METGPHQNTGWSRRGRFFHLGYGDRLSLGSNLETTGTDTGILTGSQEEIRAAIRSILHAEGVGLAQASAGRWTCFSIDWL